MKFFEFDFQGKTNRGDWWDTLNHNTPKQEEIYEHFDYITPFWNSFCMYQLLQRCDSVWSKFPERMCFPILLCRAEFPENKTFLTKFPEIRNISNKISWNRKIPEKSHLWLSSAVGLLNGIIFLRTKPASSPPQHNQVNYYTLAHFMP